MMNFYGIRKANSESKFRADARTNRLIAKRISNYELVRGNQNTHDTGIDSEMITFMQWFIWFVPLYA